MLLNTLFTSFLLTEAVVLLLFSFYSILVLAPSAVAFSGSSLFPSLVHSSPTLLQNIHFHRRSFMPSTVGVATATATAAAASSSSSSSTSTTTKADLTLVGGISDIVNDYDVFLLDMWGVMHDGYTAFDGVIECIQKLRAAGKRIIIVSNSSQRKQNSVRNLERLGFDPTNDFEQIITSGEVSFQLLSSPSPSSSSSGPFASKEELGGCCEPWNTLTKIQNANQQQGKNNKVLVLGTSDERDVPYVEGCGWDFAPIEEADLILACGTFTVNDGNGNDINKRTDADAYNVALTRALRIGAARGIPMMVSNPDKIRPDCERPPMPGRLGDLYEMALVEHGGKTKAEAEALVKRIGKPFQEVFDIALKDTLDTSRACMIGDALETDVTGGRNAGIDTIWILKDGVYLPELEEAAAQGTSLLEGAQAILEDFNMNVINAKKDMGTTCYAMERQMPTVAMPHFRW